MGGIEESPLGIIDLFRSPKTKVSAYYLLAGFMLAYSSLMYQLYQSETDLAVAKYESDESSKKQELSRAVMAIHIAMLKRQLIDDSIVPIPSTQALRYSRQFVQTPEDTDIRWRSLRQSSLRQLIPLHSEYDPSRIFKYN